MPQLSVWEKESFFAPQDVIIVGSGFTGLWSALHLININPGLKITILEKGIIPTGASTRNAGFSCFGSPSELVNDSALMGEDKMWQLVEMRYRGLSEIRKHFTADTIDYNPHGGYECFTNDSEDWQICKEKISWLNAGLEKISGEKNIYSAADNKLNDLGLKGFDHLIENKAEAGLHPGKLVQCLLKKVQTAGVQVLSGIDVKSFENNGSGVTVNISDNAPGSSFIHLRTRQLLLCTNAFTKQFIRSIDIKPGRGQVLLTSPIENLQLKGVFHFERGFYYFRNIGDRILIGGARNKAFDAEETTDINVTETIQTELESFIRKHIVTQSSFSITDRWSGIMAMGKEKLPIIKEVEPNIFCCVRMSGMGVALAPVVAKQVARLMTS